MICARDEMVRDVGLGGPPVQNVVLPPAHNARRILPPLPTWITYNHDASRENWNQTTDIMYTALLQNAPVPPFVSPTNAERTLRAQAPEHHLCPPPSLCTFRVTQLDVLTPDQCIAAVSPSLPLGWLQGRDIYEI